MPFSVFEPCQPAWLCGPLLWLFSLMLLVGLIAFIRIVFREYQRVVRGRAVMARRRLHYRQRPKPGAKRRSRRK